MRSAALLPVLVLAIPVAVFACEQGSTSESTSSTEAPLDASWFAKHLPEGSPLAATVLSVANDRGLTVDEYVDTVKITHEAALALVGYRDGDDVADHGDDEKYDTLAELDAVPFTNLTFWNAMIAYARGLEPLPPVDGGRPPPVDGGAATYLPFGVQTNVPAAELAGWTQCWKSTYDTSGEKVAQILSKCSGGKLLMACRPVGSDTYQALAWAPSGDVTADTGTGNKPHDANGVGWYFSDSYSWGFAAEGDTIQRSSCDVGDKNPEQRLCWHTSGGVTNGGWRCGANTDLNSDSTFERVIYTAP